MEEEKQYRQPVSHVSAAKQGNNAMTIRDNRERLSGNNLSAMLQCKTDDNGCAGSLTTGVKQFVRENEAGTGYDFHLTNELSDGVEKQDAYVTVGVDQVGAGHTYLILEFGGKVTMFHFRAEAEGCCEKSGKVIHGTGIFEEITNLNKGGKTPEAFMVDRRSRPEKPVKISLAECRVPYSKAVEIDAKCRGMVGGESKFSLVGGNFGYGDNCLSKVFHILKECNVQFNMRTWLFSFLWPRLAIGWGSGIGMKEEPKEKAE